MAEHRHHHHAAAANSPESSPTSDNESGGGGGTTGGGGGSGHSNSIREQDRLLPIANVGRIMKRALPANAKISKDAKETVQECVSEFISFITGEASDKCQREKRKTINGDDLLWGMTTLGFEEYVEPLKVYLHKYRELEGEKSSMAKQGEQQQQQHQSLQRDNLSTPNGTPSLRGANGSLNNPSRAQQQQQNPYGHGPMVYAQQQPLLMPYHMPMHNPGTGSGTGHGR
eukprot:Gb_07620 [translate_table: standard]